MEIFLTITEQKTVEQLLKSPQLTDLQQVLQAMLDHGTKEDFEQESLGLAGLLRVFERLRGGESHF